MSQENLQEQCQLLTTLLQECCFCVSDILLLWERWHTIRASNLTLDERLELSERGIPVFQMERDFPWSHDFNDVHCVSRIHLILDNLRFEVDGVDYVCRAAFFCHI